MGLFDEVLGLKKDLKKAMETSKFSTAIDVLNKLRQIPANEDLLKKTEVGLFVGKLRSNPSADVAKAAKEVVKKWKDDVVNKSKQEKSSKPSSPVHKRPVEEKPKIITKPAASTPTSQRSASPKTPKDDKERTVATDRVTLKSTGNKARDKCAEMIYAALATNSDADSEIISAKATNIEKNVFGDFEAVDSKYKAKMRSLYLNLKDRNNPSLRASVLAGEISVERLCTMSTADMASEERKAQDRAIQEENLFKARGAGPTAAETDAFRCGKCGGRKCTYFQMQTRSADEPMTTFVTCTICQNKWKFC
ncbi:transcription elongation factor S-II [Basidiobolus meristosporus CBS 931.73]|uniref:Transcription elongation factor n=1 Tax=Basidiobolus meristosporus CBS 931.73 TaxID=1314790 RepID=A0A1Y1X7C1_9FUNG|nr:transcription elongation factor S-II [Basidiobolus meristosporus CBS 931.73]|eukprot:ORX81670.1 transcription elongation factor S-II [Basidiobolus meristosporus CBS 931.73]